MSIHDETWDRCQWCGNVNKTWHRDYHTSRGCLKYGNYHDWFDSLTIYVDEKEGWTHYTTVDGKVITKITDKNEKNKE